VKKEFKFEANGCAGTALGCGLIVATMLFACLCLGLCVWVFRWAAGI